MGGVTNRRMVTDAPGTTHDAMELFFPAVDVDSEACWK